MKLPSSLVGVALLGLLFASVLGSLALWPSGGADSDARAQPEPTGDKAAIFTATPAPTPTPTPVPSGIVVEVVYRCSLYFFDGPHWVVQDPAQADSGSACVPPYPPSMTVYATDGARLFDIQGLQLTITIRQDSGTLFEATRAGPFTVAVGAAWPLE